MFLIRQRKMTVSLAYNWNRLEASEKRKSTVQRADGRIATSTTGIMNILIFLTLSYSNSLSWLIPRRTYQEQIHGRSLIAFFSLCFLKENLLLPINVKKNSELSFRHHDRG